MSCAEGQAAPWAGKEKDGSSQCLGRLAQQEIQTAGGACDPGRSQLGVWSGLRCGRQEQEDTLGLSVATGPSPLSLNDPDFLSQSLKH